MSARDEQDYLALAAVADAVNDALAAGRIPDVDAMVAEHPTLEEHIRQLIPALAALHELSPAGEPETHVDALRREMQGTLGDFRIVGEVGRGGMGVVYEAEQISLGRRVALKVLPFAAVLDRRHLRRFQIEAQAAARLHHSHIVPVYGVGEERGVHYYAMQFVEGRTLADVITELGAEGGEPPSEITRSILRGASGDTNAADPASTGGAAAKATGTQSRPFFRAVARLGIQAAEALHHAHGMGVIHRDVKPSNLIVDGEGHIWVTDFGLARLAGDPGMTLSGDILGTLRYMSPEQSLATRAPVDFHTDIYSLGATLYEMLVLRPALDGDDRRELLHKIGRDDPPRPRRLNPAVPPELEIIVMKAMAKDPADRFASAGELADDLRRYLDDEPIHARPPTVLQRARKWVRRHQHAVTGAVVVLVIAAAALAVSSAFIWRAKHRTEEALLRAERARVEAETSFRTAYAAVDRMLTRLGQGGLADVPRLTPIRRDLLEEALRFHLGFLEAEDAPAQRLETARAYRRVAGLQEALGKQEDAAVSRGHELELLEALHRSEPESKALRRELAVGLNGLGLHHMNAGDYARADRELQRARALLTELHAADSADPEARRSLAVNHNFYANLLGNQGRSEPRANEHHRAAALLEPLVEGGNDASDRFRLASNFLNQANVEWDLGRRDASLATSRRALELFETTAKKNAWDVPTRESMALIHFNLGVRFHSTGRPKEAEASFTKSLALYEPLRRDFPNRLETRFEWARACNGYGVHLQRQGRARDAVLRYDRAREEMESVLHRSPAVPAYRALLAEILENLCILHLDRRRFRRAEEAVSREIELLAGLVAGVRDHPRYGERLATARVRMAQILKGRGELSEAEAGYRRAIADFARVGEESALTPRARRDLAEAWNGLGLIKLAAGEHAEAAESFRRALEVHDRLLPALRNPRAYARHRALLWSNLGSVRQEQGRYAEAIAACEKALELQDDHFNARANLAFCLAAAPSRANRDPQRAVTLAEWTIRRAPKSRSGWNAYAIALVRAGRHEDAIRAARKAADIAEGQTVSRLYVIALAYHGLGDATRAEDHFDEAEDNRHLESPDDVALEALRAEAAAALGKRFGPEEGRKP